MAENVTPVANRLFNGRYHAPGPCPPGAVGPSGRADAASTYSPDLLSNAEAELLQRAAIAAEDTLIGALPRIRRATRTLLSRHSVACTTLTELDAVDRSGSLGRRQADVRRIEARHEDDGPDDRRHRPLWARIVLVPTVLAAAAYDTAFFSRVFLKFVDSRATPTNPAFYVSLVPGVVLAVALLVTGHLMGRAALRARSHRERRLEQIRPLARLIGWIWRRPPATDTRTRDDLPWPQRWPAIAFGLAVLSILGLWAVNRATDTAPGVALETPPGAVAALLLLLSVSAIAVKVIHYNSFADSARSARRGLIRARWRQRYLVRRGARALAQYAAAAHELRELLDEADRRAHGQLERAWAEVLAERERHGRAGIVAPRFVQVPDGAEPRRGSPLVGIDQPQVTLQVLRSAEAALHDVDVAADRARYEQTVERLVGQLAA